MEEYLPMVNLNMKGYENQFPDLVLTSMDMLLKGEFFKLFYHGLFSTAFRGKVSFGMPNFQDIKHCLTHTKKEKNVFISTKIANQVSFCASNCVLIW